MCGIVSYIGPREAYPIIVKGLKRLEYRGYDSAGVALIHNDELNIYKTKGKVADLETSTEGKDVSGHVGMGHTRWATHGEPNNVNAHPHLSQSKNLAVIHNGIIENYATIKEELQQRGHVFASDTDTEVLIHLIEDIQINENISIDESVRLALNQVIGAYAIVILVKNEPAKLIAARKGSPLVVGIGDQPGEYFMASDATPIVEYTRDVFYLNDGEIAIIKDGKLIVKTIDNVTKTPFIQKLEINLEQIEKGGYPHFMLKEIYEQPKSIHDSIRGRIDSIQGKFAMRSIHEYEDKLRNVKRLILIGCGTSWHAALVGEYLFEEYARIPVEVEYASEFRYRDPIIYPDDLVIAISQSGETADTLAAMELAKEKGATVFGVCNVVGSSIPRMSHAGAYTHAGPEIGVASTKAFTTQVSCLCLCALWFSQDRNINKHIRTHIIKDLQNLSADFTKCLDVAYSSVDNAVNVLSKYNNLFILGKNNDEAIAHEGALKIKEIAYIHSEGFSSSALKHGPFALLGPDMPLILLNNNVEYEPKVLNCYEEVASRKSPIIFITNNAHMQKENTIYIPYNESFSSLLSIIPFQLIAYKISVLRGINPDKPKNLAKVVTVE